MLAPHSFEQELFGAYVMQGGTEERSAALKLRSVEKRLLFSRSPFEVTGTVDLDGLVTGGSLRGWVDLSKMGTGAEAYRLEVCADDGATLVLVLSRVGGLKQPFFSLSRWVGELRRATGERMAGLELRADFRRSIGRWLGA